MKDYIEPLRRTMQAYTGSIYGFRCKFCGGWWKIYQNEYHQQGCRIAQGQSTGK